MLVGSVVEHQFGDDAQSARVGFAEKHLEIAQRAVGGMDVGVVGDVVAVVLPWRGAKRQQPERRDAEILQVIEFFGEAGEIAHAVAV